MAGQGIRVGPLFAAGGGVLLLWSAVTGRKWSTVFRDLIKGQNPVTVTPTNQITGTPLSAFGPSGAAGSSGFGNSSTSSTLHGDAWSAALLKTMGAPQNPANIASLNAWQAREGGGGANNPLNTTLNCCGGTNFNSIGVKNYPTETAGIQATISTLHGYPLIFLSLMAGRGLCGEAFASEFSEWSGGGYSSVC